MSVSIENGEMIGCVFSVKNYLHFKFRVNFQRSKIANLSTYGPKTLWAAQKEKRIEKKINYHVQSGHKFPWNDIHTIPTSARLT